MPRTVSLAAYLVKIRDVAEREDEILSDFADDQDFLEYLDTQLSLMKTAKHNEQSQQVLSISTLMKEDRILKGIIQTGEYGLESLIYSVVQRRVVHKRGKQEADLWPFYFLFEIPEGPDEGLLNSSENWQLWDQACFKSLFG